MVLWRTQALLQEKCVKSLGLGSQGITNGSHWAEALALPGSIHSEERLGGVHPHHPYSLIIPRQSGL